MGDVYFLSCPICGSDNVRLPFKPEDVKEVREGVKKLLVLPCCHESFKIVDSDSDYLLADRPLRK